MLHVAAPTMSTISESWHKHRFHTGKTARVQKPQHSQGEFTQSDVKSYGKWREEADDNFVQKSIFAYSNIDFSAYKPNFQDFFFNTL